MVNEAEEPVLSWLPTASFAMTVKWWAPSVRPVRVSGDVQSLGVSASRAQR